MSSRALTTACRDLAWSLWTELGVPGVVRAHEGFVVDPEPLVVWSPSVVETDPRLRDLVLDWCRQNGDRLSVSRLRGLLRAMPPTSIDEFERFAFALNTCSGLRWPVSGRPDRPWSVRVEASNLPLPMDRLGLLRLRLRALAGVGTRADVLCELLAAGQRWVSASELAEEGYTKRNIARVLSELEAAGIARSRARGNSLRFQLAAPHILGRLVGAHSPVVPRWTRLFHLLARLLDLVTRSDGRSPAVQRVEAHKVREEIAPAAAELRLPFPPATTGRPDAYEALLSWSALWAREVAEGRSIPVDRG